MNEISFFKKAESIEKYILSWRLPTNRWALYVALFCTLNSLFFAFPSYQRIFATDVKDNDYLPFWNRINEQIDHPFTHFDYPPAFHEAKVSFRLLAPLVAKLSPFQSLNSRMAYLFFIQHVAGFFFFFFLALFTLRYSQSRIVATLLAVSFSITYLGHCFFYELYGFFDGIAFTLLLMCMYHYKKWFCSILFFLSFWIDERAVVSSGLVFLFIITQEHNLLDKSKWKSLLIKSAPFIVGYVLYLSLRQFMHIQFGMSVPIGTKHDAGLGLIMQQILTLPLATFLSFEGFWILFCFGIVSMWNKNLGAVLVLYLLNFIIIVLISYSVWDVTRSLVYGFPLFLIGARYFLTSFSVKTATYVFSVVLFFNIIVPSYKNHYFTFYWQIPLPVKAAYYIVGGK